MSDTQQEQQEVELPMIPQDGGMPEAARYRLGLAMLITMLAEMAEDVGPIKVEMLHDLATNLVTGNERGLQLINAHSFKMGLVKIVAPVEDEEGGDDE